MKEKVFLPGHYEIVSPNVKHPQNILHAGSRRKCLLTLIGVFFFVKHDLDYLIVHEILISRCQA